MKYVMALAAAAMMSAMIPVAASAQGWNQKAYNNSQAAKKSQQHYNNQTRRR
ncbi:MAG: hypothetical protein AB7J19_16020 [Beijerinckiaceae bacterium]